jgi:hypothetical protein
MTEITTQNTDIVLKDKNNNIPQILIFVKNKIETPEFKEKIINLLPAIKNLEGNVLNIQNAGKKYTKKRRHKLNKTIKRSNKSGGQPNMNVSSVKFIILAIIIAISFTVPVSQVSSMFESLLFYPNAFFENVITPFTNVLLDAANVKDSVGYSALQTTTSSVIIPTIKGVYKHTVGSLTGNVLGLNGLWALYLNFNKFISYVSTPVSKPDVKVTAAEVSASLNDVAKDIIDKPVLPNENLLPNFKTVDIPSGSKLLLSENQNIC